MDETASPSNRWLRFSIRDVILLIALIAVCLAWWASHRRSAHTDPSPTFAAFDIAKILQDSGYEVRPSATERTGNSVTGRSQIITAGTITGPPGYSCFDIFNLVRRPLDAAAGGSALQEGWLPVSQEHPTRPVRISTLYNQGQRHGELHLWLFPNEDESEVDYALYLVEAPLR